MWPIKQRLTTLPYARYVYFEFYKQMHAICIVRTMHLRGITNPDHQSWHALRFLIRRCFLTWDGQRNLGSMLRGEKNFSHCNYIHTGCGARPTYHRQQEGDWSLPCIWLEMELHLNSPYTPSCYGA
jgi:hypothetical protein